MLQRASTAEVPTALPRAGVGGTLAADRTLGTGSLLGLLLIVGLLASGTLTVARRTRVHQARIR